MNGGGGGDAAAAAATAEIMILRNKSNYMQAPGGGCFQSQPREIMLWDGVGKTNEMHLGILGEYD